jgi:hypothetical protein
MQSLHINLEGLMFYEASIRLERASREDLLSDLDAVAKFLEERKLQRKSHRAVDAVRAAERILNQEAA